jgi:hypothetical protein
MAALGDFGGKIIARERIFPGRLTKISLGSGFLGYWAIGRSGVVQNEDATVTEGRGIGHSVHYQLVREILREGMLSEMIFRFGSRSYLSSAAYREFPYRFHIRSNALFEVSETRGGFILGLFLHGSRHGFGNLLDDLLRA